MPVVTDLEKNYHALPNLSIKFTGFFQLIKLLLLNFININIKKLQYY